MPVTTFLQLPVAVEDAASVLMVLKNGNGEVRFPLLQFLD